MRALDRQQSPFFFYHAGVALLISAALLGGTFAQRANAQPQKKNRASLTQSTEEGPKWAELTVKQKDALKPLEREWPSMKADSKERWIETAQRLLDKPASERERIQARMTEWARMTPQERGKARLQFQEAKDIAPEERAARWKAYQELSSEEKQRLAERAAKSSPAASAAAVDGKGKSRKSTAEQEKKLNTTPNPAFAAPPKRVAPTVVQAQPGATTTLISKRPAPPVHQQTGLPKIAANPGFIDKATLLPQRGAQGAAAQKPASPASAVHP
jgi:hypothetical protein